MTEQKESAWVGVAKSFISGLLYFFIWICIGFLFGMNPLVAINWAYLWLINTLILFGLVLLIILLIVLLIVCVVYIIATIIER